MSALNNEEKVRIAKNKNSQSLKRILMKDPPKIRITRKASTELTSDQNSNPFRRRSITIMDTSFDLDEKPSIARAAKARVMMNRARKSE